MLICSVANFGDGNISAIANFRRSMAWQHTVPGRVTASASQYNCPFVALSQRFDYPTGRVLFTFSFPIGQVTKNATILPR